MKKIFIFSAFILMILFVSAQERKFNFGLHVSPNISWLKSDVDGAVYKSDGSNVHVGYGADFNYFFIDNLGIGTGVNIVHTGGRLQYETKFPTEADSAGILEIKYRLQYLEVPLVMVGTTGNMLGKFAIYAKFGLGTSFKLRARSNNRFSPDDGSPTIVEDNKNISKSISFMRESMIIGVGATYKVAKIISVNLGLTYNNGFTDALTGVNLKNTSIKENAKTNYFEIALGVLF